MNSLFALKLTNANDFFNLYAGSIDFFGKFSHSLVGVLVCKRIHICSNTWNIVITEYW